MTSCSFCSKEFESKRSTAKYCSAKCRVYSNRRISVTDLKVSVTKELSVTEPIIIKESVPTYCERKHKSLLVYARNCGCY